jgi:predicted O-linked N-acetylglucosamine transferase (SPINDLY family)
MHVRYYTDLAGESAVPAARGLDDAERWLVAGRKLRVGYLSEDFGHTSVGQLVQARNWLRVSE